VILCVDPGLPGLGCSLWRSSGRLLRGWYQPNPYREGNGPRAWNALARALSADLLDFFRRTRPGELLVEVVFEFPEIYRGGAKFKNPDGSVRVANPNALFQLVGVLGAVGRELRRAEFTTYLPRTWKGRRKKSEHGPAILAALHPEERAAIQGGLSKTLAHNVVDAVGLGLFHLRARRQGFSATPAYTPPPSLTSSR
jgi:hypothetical protein